MATEEMKPETKKTQEKKQSPEEVKDLPPPQQQHKIPPLPYKTCSLKVSIHCEGCKRKVKKILSSIEGVYKVDIDVKLHKVTVIGIASPEILLQKLLKAGKNTQLLPEIPDPVENKPVVAPIEKENKKKNKKKKKEEKTDGATTSSGPTSDKPESEKPDAVDGGETSGPAKEEKKEVLKEKEPAQADSPAPAESQSPATEKKVEENGGDAAASGNVGKKKKKKGQKPSNAANNPTGAPARPGSPPLTTTPVAAAATDHDRPFNQNDILTNNNPPGHHMYHPYPPSYYAPQVMYGVSYNVAQPPVGIDTASYYTPPPPHSYAYMHPGYPPHDQNPYYPSRPSDSFELFSDENPNGCSVM